LVGFGTATTALLEYLLPGTLTDQLFWAGLCLVFLDSISAYLAGLRRKGPAIYSSKLRKTGEKLVGYGVAYLSVVLAAQALQVGQVEWAAVAILSWVVLTEAISIFENLVVAGVPIPKGLVKLFRAKLDRFEKSCEYLEEEETCKKL
jgi:phage-related holin